MQEEPYKSEHLQKYTGILTSDNAHNGKFKMELKVEDNPVLKERWTEKNKSSIELEFKYNGGPSAMFFHNRHTCPVCLENKECREYKRISEIYNIFQEDLSYLQFGDTFRISAALINNDQSVLPAEIQGFDNYQPLLAACTGNSLRLDDTPEGNNKRYERDQQRKQQKREAEEKRKKDKEQAQEEAKTRQRNERIQQIFGDKPYISQIIITVIATTIANQILPYLFRWIISLF